MEVIHKLIIPPPSDTLKKPSTLYFDHFFKDYCSNEIDNKCTATCNLCGSSVAAQLGISSNFKRHLKRHHPKILEGFENLVIPNAKTTIKEINEALELKIQESFSLAWENSCNNGFNKHNEELHESPSLVKYNKLNFSKSLLFPPEGFEYFARDYSTGVYIYNKEWESIPLYSAWLNQSSQSKSAAYCAQCNCDFSIAKRGIEEIERHLVEKHLDRQFEDAGPLAAKRWCDSVQTSPEMNQSLSLIQRDDRSPENPDPNYHETNQPRQRQFPNVVTINVGGHIFKTRLSTLTKYPNSMLAAMFSGRHTIDKDEDGLYFIDSNGSLFGYILDYLRRDKLPPTHAALDIYKEALYFGLDSLVQKLSLNPSVCSILVRESIRQQFPNYEEVKMNMIKVAASTCTVNRTSQVNVYAFKTIVQPKLEEGDSTHECIASKADIIFGPWDSSPDEDAFVTCLENDLREEGFTLNEGSKKRCRYYQGLFSCPKTLYMFNFSFL